MAQHDSSTIDGANVCMRLHGWRPNITIPIVCGGTNLPCVYNSFVSEKVKREYASKMRSALKASCLFTALDFFGDLPFTMPAQDSNKVGDMVPKNSRHIFTSLDFFGDLPSTMPAQDSDKVGDMVPKNSRQ
jgi:hypothetical protein